MLTLELDNTTEHELIEIAEQTGVTINQLLKDVLKEYLEDMQDVAKATKVMDDITTGKEPVYSSEQAKEMLSCLG